MVRLLHPEFWNNIRNNRELGFQPDMMLLTDRHFHMFLRNGDFSDLRLVMMRQVQMPFEPGVAYLPFGEAYMTTLAANVLAVHFGCTQLELAGHFLRTAIHPEVQEQITR